MTGSIHLWPYVGDPPEADELRTALNLSGSDYTYIVATAAQERARINLAPEWQFKEEPGPEGLIKRRQMVFHKVMRLMVKEPLVTRSEERVSLQRAATAVITDAVRREIIRHDVSAWREALAKLAEEGVNLTPGIPASLAGRLVNQSVGQVLRDLQVAYKQAQAEYRRVPYEVAAHNLVAIGDVPGIGKVVVMEGFTYLTPLQRMFVKQCRAQGAKVHLVFPYRKEQSHGYAVIKRTYGLADERDPVFVHLSPSGTDLVRLQSLLFTGAQEAGANDQTIVLRSFSHRHREIAFCIGEIERLINEEKVLPKEMAIVTRNGKEFDTLLLEEAELRGLTELLRIPPRLLLLTPVGRFVLVLYEIWTNGRLEMDAEQFHTILASGWLGSALQETADEFEAAKDQVFAQCRTQQDWIQAFADLKKMRPKLPPGSRAPANLLTDTVLQGWEKLVVEIAGLCRRLFTNGSKSIARHIEDLMDELKRMTLADVRKAELEILEKIRQELSKATGTTSLPISADEFGDVLVGLAKERETEETEDESAEEEQAGTSSSVGSLDDAGRVWVTTPEGIDGARRKFVFYLGLDNHRVPRGYPEPWPYREVSLDEHHERERYMFLTVVRAAAQRLYLTYASSDVDGTYTPSPYLLTAAESLGYTIDFEQYTVDTVDEPPITRGLVGASRKEYNLEELVHFRLCPFRYKLELLDRGARHYRRAFQLKFLAEGTWLNFILRYMKEHPSNPVGKEAIRAAFFDAMDQTEKWIRKAFPGLRDLHWLTVRVHVKRQLEYQADWLGEKSFPVSIAEGFEAKRLVENGDPRYVTISAQHTFKRGKFRYVTTSDSMAEEWLMPGKASDKAMPPHRTVAGVTVFSSLYHAVQWWQAKTRAAATYQLSQGLLGKSEYDEMEPELRDVIKAVEAGQYPKSPGEHCKYCSVYSECLGVEP